MPDVRRNPKPTKKDQRSTRETRDEIGEETRSTATKARQENPNRDRARGDWDRSGIHHDEGTSRAPEPVENAEIGEELTREEKGVEADTEEADEQASEENVE